MTKNYIRTERQDDNRLYHKYGKVEEIQHLFNTVEQGVHEGIVTIPLGGYGTEVFPIQGMAEVGHVYDVCWIRRANKTNIRTIIGSIRFRIMSIEWGENRSGWKLQVERL